MSSDLERALASGESVLAYIRPDGGVSWWTPLEPTLTGEIRLDMYQGGVRRAEANSRTLLTGNGAVELREG